MNSTNINTDRTELRCLRCKETAECFTPSALVQEMLSKLGKYSKKSYTDPCFTYCDPACGNGNILVEVLKMKLSHKHDPDQALSTLYGCDIKQDNIRECRLRLLQIIRDSGTKITREHVKTVFNQIVLTSLKRYKEGSLSYDFSFENKASGKDVDLWLDGIENEGWLDNPSAVTKSLLQADDNMADATESSIFD